MLRVPLEGLKAQSKTGRCSGFRWGAPSIVSLSPRYWRIASASARGYPSLFNASGTVLFTILMTPPPTSHLYLTSAMSLDPGRVAVHHEGYSAGRCDD